jgi:hypothetical protein
MTTIVHKEVPCFQCGAQSEFLVLASTNRMGWLDLDTRPPEMERSTMRTWVQRCPKCGYCASDVSAPRPEAAAVVSTREYKRQLADPEFPPLANSFLCKALIESACGEYSAEAWALIHAAWVCDDSGHLDQAAVCRQRAAEALARAEEHGQRLTEQEGAGTAILVDLLRRSGRFDQARRVIAERRDTISDDIILRVLNFQMWLIDQDDESCHTIAEAYEQGR